MNTLKLFFIRFLVILLAFPAALFWQLVTVAPVHAATQDVVINEVMWMGSSSSSDEWIELRNTTASDIAIGNWQITNSSTAGDERLTLPSDALIPAGGFYLIARFDESASDLAVEADFVAAQSGNILQIDNTCDTGSTTYMQLLNGELVVDEAGCLVAGGAPFEGSNGTPKKAMERNIVITNGTLPTSWHTSVGSANLDDLVTNLATPNVTNDTTVPDASEAFANDTDGVSTADVDITFSSDALFGAWDGFVDTETDMVYRYGYALTSGGPVVEIDTTFDLEAMIDLALTHGQTYFVAVKAINEVSLASAWRYSDGATHQAPATPMLSTVTDVPSDNGGQVELTWNAVEGAETYQTQYRLLGTSVWVTGPTSETASVIVAGLLSRTTSAENLYEFQVMATGFNGLVSGYSDVRTGQALDNLAPVLDVTKVIVGQNNPGTTDTVTGSTGAVSEANTTVYVFNRHPSETDKVLINSVMGHTDGGFSLMGIGDNLYGQIWIQVVDQAGNSSDPKSFSNDIVAPNAPSLVKVEANCVSDPCRVQLNWVDNGPDTAYYKVGYVASPETRTLALSSTSAVLDLTADKHYTFRVYAYDKYGNESARSNEISIRLTPGVRTVAEFIDGKQVTKTYAVLGAREVWNSKGGMEVLKGYVAPPAQAHDGQADGDQDNSSGSSQDGKVDADNQDWVRIFIVVLLLLIIAGSFYALSRSIRDNGTAAAATTVADKPTATKRQAGARKAAPKRRGGATRGRAR